MAGSAETIQDIAPQSQCYFDNSELPISLLLSPNYNINVIIMNNMEQSPS